MNVAEAIKADRKRRGNLSRKAYADLTGLTPTKISNLEGSAVKAGRKFKSGEEEKIMPLIADLLALPSDAPAPEVEETDEWTVKRQQLQRDFDAIKEALAGKPAPIPWPLGHTPVADAKPSEFERVQRWIDQMYHVRLPDVAILDDEPPSEPPIEPPEESAPVYDPATREDDPDVVIVHRSEEYDEFVYFENPRPVKVITDARLISVSLDVNPAPLLEGGPGPTQTAPLPDDFQVRHQR